MVTLISIVVVFNIIVFMIPRRMSGIEIVATDLFAMCFEVIVDVYLDLKYDLYGYFVKGPDFQSLLYVFGIFPAVSYIYLNLFPYRRRSIIKLFYILVCVAVSGIIECFFLWSKTYYYNGWNLAYSLLLYPFIFLILNGFHKFILYLIKKAANHSSS